MEQSQKLRAPSAPSGSQGLHLQRSQARELLQPKPCSLLFYCLAPFNLDMEKRQTETENTDVCSWPELSQHWLGDGAAIAVQQEKEELPGRSVVALCGAGRTFPQRTGYNNDLPAEFYFQDQVLLEKPNERPYFWGLEIAKCNRQIGAQKKTEPRNQSSKTSQPIFTSPPTP